MAPDPHHTAFVLVPAGFMQGSLYHKVTTRLSKLGYSVKPIDPPSSNTKAPAVMAEDAALINKMAASLMDQGKNVVVVGCSYGGVAATEAMRGLSDADRKADGRSGGRLVNLVYIGSLMGRAGQNTVDITVEGGAPPGMKSEEDFAPVMPNEYARMALGDDLSDAEVAEVMASQKPQSAASAKSKLTYEGYYHVPVTFVVTEGDKLLPPSGMHANADRVIATGKANVTKRSIDTPHLAMVTHPDEVVKILLEAAETS